jgi:Skp family chaperone for outer membrane proteins
MTTILTVDLPAVLDKSRLGADASKALEKAWADAKSQSEEAKRALLVELEKKRDTLREKLLARARPIIAELGKQKGAAAVLEKGSVAWANGEDITQAVIAKLDAGAPL